MTIYHIQSQKVEGDKVTTYMPELTASERAAQERKRYLMEQGMTYVFITEYEVKTQGVNFNTIAQAKV